MIRNFDAGRVRQAVRHNSRRHEGPSTEGGGHQGVRFQASANRTSTRPKHICEAAEKAASSAGNTHYTLTSGTAEVKAGRSASGTRAFHGLDVLAENVIVSNGAKHSIHNALAATVGPGDEVIIPTPYWVSYSDLVSMTGATPVLVTTIARSGFKMSPAQLRAAVTPHTRVLMLNSPCNPTGTVYSRTELEALVDAMDGTDAAILSDEIYEQLIYSMPQNRRAWQRSARG